MQAKDELEHKFRYERNSVKKTTWTFWTRYSVMTTALFSHRNATNRLDKLVKELDKEVRMDCHCSSATVWPRPPRIAWVYCVLVSLIRWTADSAWRPRWGRWSANTRCCSTTVPRTSAKSRSRRTGNAAWRTNVSSYISLGPSVILCVPLLLFKPMTSDETFSFIDLVFLSFPR